MGSEPTSAVELLTQARSAGLAVSADGIRLVVRGPKAGQELVMRLLARKAELLALLTSKAPAVAVAGIPWDPAEGGRLLTNTKAHVAQARREPALTWESVRRLLLELVQEAFDAQDLPLLQERCKVARQVADGMPAYEDWPCWKRQKAETETRNREAAHV